jgi:hypothetical protein
MNNLAPIVLFVYNRPVHTLNCLNSLKLNKLAKDSDLFIYVDYVSNRNDEINIQNNKKVIEVINQEKWCGTVTIIYREINFGIEKNTIEAVSELLNIYGKVIVIEDDLILSNSFLSFMNEGLEAFKSEDKVKQICGCNLLEFVDEKTDAMFLPISSSWGWGTWQRVWKQIDFNEKNIYLTQKEQYVFNIENTFPYYTMLTKQFEMQGKNTWDILFWLATFKQKGLVLYPKMNLVSNSGFDGSGVHYNKKLEVEKFKVYQNIDFKTFPNKIIASSQNIEKLKKVLLKLNQTKLGYLKNIAIYYYHKIFHFGQYAFKYFEK